VIFFGLLALCNAASLGPRDTSNATVVCQSEDELWGGEDIRKFYFCLDGAVITDECDPGYYFVNNMILSRPLTVDSNFLHLDALKAKCNFRLASIFFMRRPGACVIILMP